MDHAILNLLVWVPGLKTRPVYADSAQTGMISTFFESVREDLPVSMLGDVDAATLAESDERGTRNRVLRQVFQHALDRQSRGSSLRERVLASFEETLQLAFLVERQPLFENSVSIQRVTPTGQAIPRIELRYPPYLATCLEAVKERIRRRAPEAEIVSLSTAPGAFHLLGATRMAESPADGCLDRDLRYHGLENLFVLSTSAYPSSSSASPTLTLAALALRLGDRLASA
jgi:choline dehydrogenase-like flavoprotein